MMYPMILLMTSVLPTWDAATKTMWRTFGSLKASMMARR